MSEPAAEVVAGVRTVQWAPPRPTGEWILYIHGGGFTAGRPEDFSAHASQLAEGTGAVVVAPAYRLAPEHRYPAALVDGAEVATACAARRQRPARAIVGVSAGGTIAAGIATRLGPHCAGLLALESPLLDDALTSQSSLTATDPVWSTADSRRAWSAYLPPGAPDEARPGRVVGGLPPVYVSVGAREASLDETTDWAARLRAAGGRCTLRIWADMVHGFETKQPTHPTSVAARKTQLEAILRA